MVSTRPNRSANETVLLFPGKLILGMPISLPWPHVAYRRGALLRLWKRSRTSRCCHAAPLQPRVSGTAWRLLQRNLVYRRPERLDDISFLPAVMKWTAPTLYRCFRNIHERDALYIQCMLIVENNCTGQEKSWRFEPVMLKHGGRSNDHVADGVVSKGSDYHFPSHGCRMMIPLVFSFNQPLK